MPARVLIACDSFKGSLSAVEVAAALRDGLLDVAPALEVTALPVADGGEGTLDTLQDRGFAAVSVTVSGPTGEPVRSRYVARDGVAVAELADACGLLRLPGGRPAPLEASSRGLGEVVHAALDAGYRRVVLAIGGSASTDGGAGMLAALGARLLDDAGRPLPDGGGALSRLADVRLGDLHPALADTELVVASDVDNPLLGPSGAVATFAAQKGADADDRAVLDAGLRRWVEVLDGPGGLRGEAARAAARPGAGAAGGVGFAAAGVLGAQVQSGARLVLDLLDVGAVVLGCDLVVTGEGRIDEQTFRGKAPMAVAQVAAAAGVPVVGVCGSSPLAAPELQRLGLAAVHRLSDLEPDTAECLRRASELVREAGRRVAAEWWGSTTSRPATLG